MFSQPLHIQYLFQNKPAFQKRTIAVYGNDKVILPVRVPNETVTTFDFNNDFELQKPVIPLRLTLSYTFAGKNHLFALYAPLGINYDGSAPFDISFQQSLFTTGQMIEGFYKFNSYRLGYRRDVLTTDRWTIGVGFTAKIRDARVKLSSDGLSDKKDDLGFVPLLHIFAAREFERWMISDLSLLY